MPANRVLKFWFLLLLACASAAAQNGLKYGYGYKCAKERVIVYYCRNDQGQPVPEIDNFCSVEYPDRPHPNPNFPVSASVLRSEMVKQVAGCSGPAASDPAIAKAMSANVDTKIFGIQLGDPFDIPACPMFQIAAAGAKTCYSALVDQVGAISRDIGGNAAIPKNVKTVYLGVNECPSWVSECTLVVTLYERKVGAVGVFTKGPSVDKAVQNALSEKYGQWKYIQPATVTPGDSAKEKIPIIVRYWELPGLYIHYQPIWSSEDGETPDIREGMIRVETESARNMRNAAPKRAKPKM
jgi:hypothetical protein